MLPIPQGWAEPAKGEGQPAEGAWEGAGEDGLAEREIARMHECLDRSLEGGGAGPPPEAMRPPTSRKRALAAPCTHPVATPGRTEGVADDAAQARTLATTPCVRRQQQRDRDRSLSLDVHGQSRTASMVNAIRSAIEASRSFESRTRLCELNLDTVLSSTSYRSIMRQAFGSDGSIVPGSGEGEGGGGAPMRAVPTITRAFEENYMREPLQGERECARGTRCECRMIDPGNPFTAVEFLTLDEIASPPEDSQLCVVCSRKETQYLYYDMVFNRAVYNCVIQRYGNVCGANEYAGECLLRCTKAGDLSCMPKPIMSHQRNRYAVFRHSQLNILCLKQVRVSPQDHASAMGLQRPASLSSPAQCAALSCTTSQDEGTQAAGVQRPGRGRGF